MLADVCLIALFGLQHSLMARDGFKQWLTRNVPEGLERATYVHASNLALWPVLLLWQPIPFVLVDLSPVRPLMTAVYWVGWLIVLLSSLNIDLLELWGVRQARSWSRGEVYVPPPFKESWLYRRVRHPIYLGLLLVFWATPQLTAGHVLFAGCMSAYIFIGTWFEERDLVRKHGQSYRDYQRKVPRLLSSPCAGCATHVMSSPMAGGSNPTKSSRSEDRRRRLAAELRSNLGKRKMQARSKAEAHARSQAESGHAPMHQGADNPPESGA